MESGSDGRLTRLNGLLDLAIQTSTVASDPYRDDITCTSHAFRTEEACRRVSKGRGGEEEPDDDPEPGAQAAAAARAAGALQPASRAAPSSAEGAVTVIPDDAGVRRFTLKYNPSWPLSIVFSKGLLLKYQVIFRHLLYCRWVERKLVEVWVDHQFTKDLGRDSSFSPSYSLRQRMLHFCRDYIYYVSAEVLEPQSHCFLESLEKAETVDEVLHSHEKFLDTCLKELLLTERDGLYRHLSKVLSTCLLFAMNLHHGLRKFAPMQDEDGASQVSKEQRRERQAERQKQYKRWVKEPAYTKMISRFQGMFESQLQGFLQQIRKESTHNYDHFLSNMLTRLDYNDYYSSQMTGVSPGSSSLDMTF